MIDSFHSSGKSSLFQIELISSRISELIVQPPALINSAGTWSISGDLCLLSFPIAISTSKALRSGTSGSAVCIYVCQISLTPCTRSGWEKLFLHLAKIVWQSVTKSLFSSVTILFLGWQPFKCLILLILLLRGVSSS